MLNNNNNTEIQETSKPDLRLKNGIFGVAIVGSSIAMYFAVKQGKTTSKKHPVLKAFGTSLLVGFVAGQFYSPEETKYNLKN